MSLPQQLWCGNDRCGNDNLQSVILKTVCYNNERARIVVYCNHAHTIYVTIKSEGIYLSQACQNGRCGNDTEKMYFSNKQ